MNRHDRRATAASSRSQDAHDHAVRELRAMKEEARKNHGPIATRLLCGWSFVMSYGPPLQAPRSAFDDMWLFSAKLYPPGRGSVEADWEFLGFASATVGAPPKPATPIETTDPNASHYWVWKEPDA